jgi:hypothetical protein
MKPTTLDECADLYALNLLNPIDAIEVAEGLVALGNAEPLLVKLASLSRDPKKSNQDDVVFIFSELGLSQRERKSAAKRISILVAQKVLDGSADVREACEWLAGPVFWASQLEELLPFKGLEDDFQEHDPNEHEDLRRDGVRLMRALVSAMG